MLWHQDLVDVVCVAASANGKLVFVSDLQGCLHCVDASHREIIATWRSDDSSAVLTSLCSTVLSDNVYLITAVDSTGFCSRHNLLC